MAYIEQTFGANERLVSKAHFHWLYYAAAVLALAASLGISAVLVSNDFASFWAWVAAVSGLRPFCRFWYRSGQLKLVLPLNGWY